MKLAWGAKVSSQFRDAVVGIAQSLGFDPSWLMACIAFETGHTFSPSARNPKSSATGLIQFMPSTARDLGTTVEELAAMPIEDQLRYVYKYLLPFSGRIKSLSDCYMAILWPKAVGEPEDFALFSGGQAYEMNKALDFDKDHVVTKAEATAFVSKALDEGLLPGNVIDYEAPIAEPARPPEQPMPPEQPTESAQPAQPNLGAIIGGVSSIVGMFNPALIPIMSALTGILPQLAPLFGAKGEKIAQNLAAAKQVEQTVVQATGAVNLEDAYTKIVTQPEAKAAATQALADSPVVTALTEVAGGIKGARDYDLAVMAAPKPFWKASAVFWVSMLLLPLVYWFVGSVIAGGAKLPDDAGTGLRLVAMLLGSEWTGESRSGIANLVIGMVLGGIVGVYYGVSVTQGRGASGTNSAGQP